MNKENKLIPELRFPEFANEGGWEECSIESIGNVVTGGTPSKEEVDFWGGDFVWVTAQDFKEKYILNSVQKLTQKGKDKSRVIPKDSVLVTCIASIGLNAINKVECATNQQINSIICNSENHFEFVYYSISHNGNRLNNLAGRTAVPIINKSVFEKFIIHKPKLFEQQKIASCLSSLDELITAHNQKLDLLKDHKKGLMQNLFPQKSELGFTRLKDDGIIETNDKKILKSSNPKNPNSDNIPKWRFKEFEKDGEWVNVSVEKLIYENILFAPKDGNHGNIHPKSSDYVKKGIPFIMASDLKNGKVDFSKCAYLKKEQADSLQKGFSINGDVLLTHKGTVGEVALLGDLEFPYIMLTPQVTYYRVKDNSKMSNAYLAAFFNSSLFQKSLFDMSGGGTRAYVGITEQQKLKISFSNSIKEQIKIASCFSSLDALIAAQVEKIEHLKLYKKGLMQGLFPKVQPQG